MKVSVIDGDVTAVPAQVLITAINSGGMWFGGIDGVIMRTAGAQFHGQAAEALRRADRSAKTIVAKQLGWYHGRFADVIFVIDDLDEPLNVVVRRGLTAASDAGYQTVSMPLIRFGVMRDVGGTTASSCGTSPWRSRELRWTSRTTSWSFPSSFTATWGSPHSCATCSAADSLPIPTSRIRDEDTRLRACGRWVFSFSEQD